MNDWRCRNCGFRFVPTTWVQGSPGEIVGQCPKCQSNATNIEKNLDTEIYNTPKTTDGRIRLDE